MPSPESPPRIEESIELVSPIKILADNGMHPRIHRTITKVLVAISVVLFVLSYFSSAFGVIAILVLWFSIPVALLGEVYSSLKTGEIRILLVRWQTIRYMDVNKHKFPRLVIRRNERPFRFWLYQAIFVFFGLSPFLIIFFLVLRSWA
jgi:hypothetical protein